MNFVRKQNTSVITLSKTELEEENPRLHKDLLDIDLPHEDGIVVVRALAAQDIHWSTLTTFAQFAAHASRSGVSIQWNFSETVTAMLADLRFEETMSGKNGH
jgi:hypothetical protein